MNLKYSCWQILLVIYYTKAENKNNQVEVRNQSLTHSAGKPWDGDYDNQILQNSDQTVNGISESLELNGNREHPKLASKKLKKNSKKSGKRGEKSKLFFFKAKRKKIPKHKSKTKRKWWKKNVKKFVKTKADETLSGLSESNELNSKREHAKVILKKLKRIQRSKGRKAIQKGGKFQNMNEIQNMEVKNQTRTVKPELYSDADYENIIRQSSDQTVDGNPASYEVNSNKKTLKLGPMKRKNNTKKSEKRGERSKQLLFKSKRKKKQKHKSKTKQHKRKHLKKKIKNNVIDGYRDSSMSGSTE